ncbi:MAG: hypothetical protein ACNI25_08725 [Halarcobacter sp.]
MEILIVLLLIVGGVLLYIFTNKKASIKPSYEKKSELVKSYEDGLKALINDNQHDKESLNQKKLEYIKNASKELHNNIFFDEAEVKQIIQRLASF